MIFRAQRTIQHTNVTPNYSLHARRGRKSSLLQVLFHSELDFGRPSNPVKFQLFGHKINALCFHRFHWDPDGLCFIISFAESFQYLLSKRACVRVKFLVRMHQHVPYEHNTTWIMSMNLDMGVSARAHVQFSNMHRAKAYLNVPHWEHNQSAALYREITTCWKLGRVDEKDLSHMVSRFSAFWLRGEH